MNFTNVLALVFVIIGAANAASKISTGEVYKIISATNHTVLDVTSRQAKNGNPIIAYEWKEKETSNQLWLAEEVAPDVYTFATVLNRKFFLDSSIKTVGELIIYEENGENNQKWIVEPIKPNAFTYYIRNFYHNNRVIELDADRRGVSLKWKDENNMNQRWVFAEKI